MRRADGQDDVRPPGQVGGLARGIGPAAGVSPAAAARSRVAGPRPAGTHSTWYPRPVRQAATAAPISPGCSSPIGVSLIRPVSRGTAPAAVPGPHYGRYQAGKTLSWPRRCAPGSGVYRLPCSTPNSSGKVAPELGEVDLTVTPGWWASTSSVLPSAFVHSTA